MVIHANGTVVGRVSMDRRVARYAGWLEDIFHRPYFSTFVERWRAARKRFRL